MTIQNNLLVLLFDAPTMHIDAVQAAIKHAEAGDYRAAYQRLQDTADYYEQGNTWAERAGRIAEQLRNTV